MPPLRRCAGALTAAAAAVAVAALMLALASTAAAAAAPRLGGFSVRPYNPAGKASLLSYFHLDARAGERLRERVLIVNGEPTPAHLLVYPVDGLTGATSGAVYTNRDVRLRGAGRWITLPLHRITLAAGERRVVGFDIVVPADARPGDHLAGVALESTDRPRRRHGAVAIVEVIRAAVAVEIRVAGPAIQRMRGRLTGIRALPGTQVPSVAIALTNLGGLDCHPQLAVTLSRGGTATTTTRHLDLVLAGDRIAYQLQWPHAMQPGVYRARARITRCGQAWTGAAALRLGHPLSGATTPPYVRPPAAARSSSDFPWWIVLIAVGAGLFGGWLLSRAGARRRR